VKVLSPEIFIVALGQRLFALEASSAACDTVSVPQRAGV